MRLSKVAVLGIVFITVMIVLTVFSKSIMNYFIPTVTIASPAYETIVEWLEDFEYINITNGNILLGLNNENAAKVEVNQYCEYSYKDGNRTRYDTGKVSAVNMEEWDCSAVITPSALLTDSVDIIGVSIIVDVEAYNYVIPDSAMITPNSLFVIEKRESYWGDEIYISLRQVKVEYSGNGKTAIYSGVSNSDYVVISWDRPLHDGQRVMLPY